MDLDIAVTADTAAPPTLGRLSLKAAEWAGCDVTGDTREPLYVGGQLRIDAEGLDRYVASFTDVGIHPDERRAIHDLQSLVAHYARGNRSTGEPDGWE